MSALLSRLGDRLNPILVKEVRQALRGRLFRFGYGFTLAAAMCIALLMLMAERSPSDDYAGPALASAIFGCLLAATLSFVPFSAFVSMGSEWDENTYDLLVLSNLRPRRIVYGKLGSALVQALVCFSAFTPFFVFAFLLRGINLPSLLALLGSALLLSPCASLVALGISSLSGNRFVRVLLMVLLAAGLAILTIGGIGLTTLAFAARAFGPSAEQLALTLGGIVSVGLAIGIFFGEVACVRLSHPEENRSTGLRIVVLVALAGAVAWATVAMSYRPDPEALSFIAIFVLFFLVLPCAFFASEPETLGRRVLVHVPKNRLVALLCAPLLPGGGRGMLFWLLVNGLLAGALALLHGAFVVAPWEPETLSKWFGDGLLSIGLTAAYCILYLGLPTGLFSRFSSSPRARIYARLCVPLLALVSILLPSIAIFVEVGPSDRVFEHWLNPFHMVDDGWNGAIGRSGDAGAIVLFLAAVAVVVLNAPRMLRGVGEVLAASAARRERERAAAAPKAPESAGDAAAAT